MLPSPQEHCVLYYSHLLNWLRERQPGNPHMGNMYQVWDRVDEAKHKIVLEEVCRVLDHLYEDDVVSDSAPRWSIKKGPVTHVARPFTSNEFRAV